MSSGRVAALCRKVLEDPDRSTSDQIYYRARLAGALLNDGEVDLAIAEGASILTAETRGHMTSARSLAELRPLRTAAEAASAEEFCVRYDAAMNALVA